jgi:hypothetical protein
MGYVEEVSVSERLADQIYEDLRSVPIIDPHTHLVGGKLGARGLHDVLLYHMAVSDLYAAGCRSGARLTQYPGWPDDSESRTRIREALPYLGDVQNTSTSWGVRIILKDLYGWEKPITEDNWRTLDAIIRERADAREWHRDVARRAGIRRFGTEIARRESGCDDDLLEYALEWAFFTRCQWGEFDTALYELERCWGRKPECPPLIGGGPRPATERQIRSLSDVHAAVAHYVDSIPGDEIVSTATHLSTDIDYRLVTDADKCPVCGDAWRGSKASGPSGNPRLDCRGTATMIAITCGSADGLCGAASIIPLPTTAPEVGEPQGFAGLFLFPPWGPGRTSRAGRTQEGWKTRSPSRRRSQPPRGGLPSSPTAPTTPPPSPAVQQLRTAPWTTPPR